MSDDQRHIELKKALRGYWANGFDTMRVRNAISDSRLVIESHPDYGKPLIDLSNKSYFDSLGNYWDNRFSSTERLFTFYD